MKLFKLFAVLVSAWATFGNFAKAQMIPDLVSFDGTDGWYPDTMSLVQGTDGDLYGTTGSGGAYGGGVIFKITPAGTPIWIYSFCEHLTSSGGYCADGGLPYSGLVQATNGDFYGTTTIGGTNDDGTVFKITAGGTLTTLYNFSGVADGADPEAGLIQAANGDFYGTTMLGGLYSYGTVFKMTPAGTLTRLYSFCAGGPPCADGEYPTAGLVQATNGDLYGTTPSGGANGSGGTIFKITPAGTLTTIYSFCALTNCTDGGAPLAVTLVQATNGDLYGTTFGGGAYGEGTVFKITPGGKFTTIYAFCGETNCPDGLGPVAGLVQAANGKLYGTTEGGGMDLNGTFFEITLKGGLTTIYSFCSQAGCTDGAQPRGAPMQDTNGNIYGPTPLGGTSSACSTTNGCGTIYSVAGLGGPFVKTLPTSGKVGAAVIILGTDLTGATSVTFNGTAATFTVASASEITTTVPTGATTGTVEVTTPSGTLSSNVVFRVKQ